MRSPQEKWPVAFRLVAEGKASRRVRECVTLAEQGLVTRQIGERLGIATSTASKYLNDPTDEKTKKRKRRYSVACSGCGASTNPGGLKRGTTGLCVGCMRRRNAERNAQIDTLWNEGMPIWAIVEETGLREGQVRGRVQAGIAKKELAFHRLGGDAEARELRRSRMIAWRSEGLTNAEIAGRLGTSPGSVAMMFRTCRSLGLDVPSARNSGRAIASPEELEDLWREGLTLEQIADFCGYSSSSAVANRIDALRRVGHDFPHRRPGRRAVHA